MSKKLEIRMLKGLPASGKSSHAETLIKEGGWVRINFDDLRDSLHRGLQYSGKRERVIQSTAYAMAAAALESGSSVIWDNTSFNPRHENKLRQMATAFEADFRIVFFTVTPEEAIRRDLAREKSVGADVIWDMYYKYIWSPTHPPLQDPTLPPAVIFDVDGTLAHNNGHRSFYDWSKVGNDGLHEEVAMVLFSLRQSGMGIVVVTGRDGSCLEETCEWLAQHNIEYEDIFIRQEGDNRPDTVVKKEIFDNHIRTKWFVSLVVDDREQVVRMWKDELGIKVLQVRHPGEHNVF